MMWNPGNRLRVKKDWRNLQATVRRKMDKLHHRPPNHRNKPDHLHTPPPHLILVSPWLTSRLMKCYQCLHFLQQWYVVVCQHLLWLKTF